MNRFPSLQEHEEFALRSHQNPIESARSGLINLATLYLTLLFIFLVPWGDAIWDGTPRIVATVTLGMSLLLVASQGTHRNYSLYHFLIVIFVGWQLFTWIWTPTPSTAWGNEVASKYVQLVMLAFVFSLSILDKKRINQAYQAYVLGNLAGSCIVVYHYINDIQFYYNRYSITEIHPDGLAVYLALAIPMAAYMLTQYKSKLFRILNLLAIPFLFFAIFLTGTRTGSVVAVFGIIYWLFTHRKSSVLIKSSIIIVFFLSIITIFSFAPKASVDRIFSTGKSLTTGTLNYRSIIWKGSISQWKNSPILGTGLASLGYVLSKEHINYEEAHNAYIHILTENGLIGLFLYLAIIFFLLYSILHTPIDEKAFLLTLLMIIIISQITSHSQAAKIISFVFTMIAIHSQQYTTLRKKY